MIRHRFDLSSMAYGTHKQARGDPAPHESTRPGNLNVCVGVASLSQWRRMPRATRPFEARLKPPPGPAPNSFSPGALRARRRRFRSAAVTDSTLSTCCP